MAEPQTFDIPFLEMDEILICFQEGLLGDMATNVLQEHIKTPTPALMMQICVSIIAKMGEDVSTLCQPNLTQSMEMKHADTYLNTYKVIHVFVAIKKLIPTLREGWTLTDLTTPRPKRVRKFICACINFFKSCENNLKVWDESISPSLAAEVQHAELKESIETNKNELSDLKNMLEELRSRRDEIEEKLQKKESEIQVLHKRKEEKELLKADSKSYFQEITNSLEKNQKHMDALKKAKENFHSQVVSDPQKYLERKHSVEQNRKVWDGKQAEAQSKLMEADKLNTQTENMSEVLTEATNSATENLSLTKAVKKLESEKQSQSYEIDNHRLEIVEDTQNAMNIKQQIFGLKETMSRTMARGKQRTAESSNARGELERERKTYESAGEVSTKVKKEEAELRSLRSQQKEREAQHKETCKELENNTQTIMNEMNKYMEETGRKILESDVAKLVGIGTE